MGRAIHHLRRTFLHRAALPHSLQDNAYYLFYVKRRHHRVNQLHCHSFLHPDQVFYVVLIC